MNGWINEGWIDEDTKRDTLKLYLSKSIKILYLIVKLVLFVTHVISKHQTPQAVVIHRLARVTQVQKQSVVLLLELALTTLL